MIKSFLKIAMVSTLALSVGRCAVMPNQFSDGGVCAGENAPLCIFIGLAVGGVLGAALGPSAAIFYHVSDSRLKTDIKYYKTTENGIKLYGYRYKGSDKVFVGVLAQDLIKDTRFKKAVIRGKDGFYRVNYAALGLGLTNGKLMANVGEAAARAAH